MPNSSVWQQIKMEMNSNAIIPRTAAANRWYGQVINRVRIPANRSNILNDPSRATSHALIGRLYAFHYVPKGEDDLPQWDRFPLVLPMEIYPDGFLGINLHYLPPMQRLALMEQLEDFLTNTRYDDSTRFKLSYSVLNGIKKYELFRPCIKRYLIEYQRSAMIYIEPDQWHLACLLPFERFYYN
jgi:hypothetical protein